MSIGPRLDLRQSQSLVMTPQLQQAIRLLALSNLEVESFIAEEIERNPLLDAGGGEEGAVAEAPAAAPEEASAADSFGTADAPLDLDVNDENFHQDSEADRALGGGLGMDGLSGGGWDGEGPDFDSFASDEVSLHGHLLAQAGERLSGTDLVIAGQIIDQVDETGYLLVSTLELAGRLGVALAEVERVLAIVQSFDPTGIAARSLAECLALQAREADRTSPPRSRTTAFSWRSPR